MTFVLPSAQDWTPFWGPRHTQRNRLRRPGRSNARRRLELSVEGGRLEDRVVLSLVSTFELDGNAITGVLGSTGSTTTSHDWDQVFADNNVTPPPVSGAVASSFVTDAVNSRNDDIFQGGGSKDTLGIQQGKWLFTDSKPQAKDDITHAYAAAYTDPSNGHLLLFAGLDRFDNSGDSTAGFWFFQNPISENSNVTQNGGHPFIGTHADGDILLVSDFTTGGSESTIKVFRWTGDDATGSLVPIVAPAGTTEAIVNGSSITVPWSYTNKSGSSSPAAGEFLEEGVDLTALGLTGCFSSFLAETRSSQSPTATLSDFVTGSFPLCSMAATPFTGLSKVGDSITYALTVKNTGAMPLFVQNVSDTLLGNIVVDHTLQSPGNAGVNPFVTAISAGGFDFSQPLAPGASLTINVTRTVQASDPDHTTSTYTVSGTDDLAGLEDPITASSTTDVNLFQPSATLTVTASPTTAQKLGDVITYTYTVNNTSSSDSPNLVLSTSNPNNSFTDTLLGNLEADAIAAGGGSLAPGGSFTFTETRAIQAGDPTPLTNTATVVFTLAQNLGSFSNQITAQASASVTLAPHLTIAKAVTSGSPDVIHPGDTASFTITVTNDGAGPATNVVLTDQLPEPDLLTWSIGTSTFDTASLSAGDLLTATKSSLAAGATASITVSALIPLDIFGNPPGTGNGDPLPSGLFELDGNALNDPSVAGDDWDNVLFGNGGSAVAHSFVTDASNSRSDDIFTGGGSKDTNGIQQGPWLSTGSKPQAKDDITHAYAATYTDAATGDVILYAGLDRFDNSGDATAGFWFLQNPISENLNVTQNGGHPFIGTHSDGDILLVSDFTTGGSVSTIKVFRWTGNDATGSLVAVATPPNSTFAIVNSGPITVPWSFTDKSHNSGPAPGEFLEEGVNLSALGLGGCFSNFLAETRSSQSPTATLSDFVIGSFNTCSLDLPNTATVKADGISSITSNQVLITVNDGDALQADAIGSGAVAAGLTDAQLQAAVAQGIRAWGAAGVDPATLSNLAGVTVHIGDLPRAELGFASPGSIWIDPTAAGWGWTGTNSALGQGGMDLATVVDHELGHALGLEHSTGPGLMASTLAAGDRLAPTAGDIAGLSLGSGSAMSTGLISPLSILVIGPSAAPASASGGSVAGTASEPATPARSSIAPATTTSAPTPVQAQVPVASPVGVPSISVGSTSTTATASNGMTPSRKPTVSLAGGRTAAARRGFASVPLPRRVEMQQEGNRHDFILRAPGALADGSSADRLIPALFPDDLPTSAPVSFEAPTDEGPSFDPLSMWACESYLADEEWADRLGGQDEVTTSTQDEGEGKALRLAKGPIAAAAFTVALAASGAIASRSSDRGWDGLAAPSQPKTRDAKHPCSGRLTRWLSLLFGRRN